MADDPSKKIDPGDIGYDWKMQRVVDPLSGKPIQETVEETSDELSLRSPETKFVGQGRLTGKDKSQGRSVIIDWQNSEIKISDGATTRIELGNIQKLGKYGIRVTDEKGNVRFESSNALERLSMFDENKNKEVIRLDENGLAIRDSSEETMIAINSSGLILFDSNSQQAALLNPSGLQIYNGKISIQNATGTSVFDSAGIISTASFPNDTVVNSTGYTTTSDTLVDVTGSTLDSFNLTRTTRVLVVIQAQMYNENFVSDQSHAELNCNDSVEGNLITTDYSCDWLLTAINQDVDKNVTGWNITTEYQFLTVMNIFDFTAGDHTLKLQFRRQGTGTARIGTYILSYIILGT